MSSKGQVEVSPVVQQALGKLNVRLADLLEQINMVIKVLFVENQKLAAEHEQLERNNSIKTENQNTIKICKS